MHAGEEVTVDEAVRLGAADSVFYSQFFFPATARQGTPEMHREAWAELDSTANRFVALKMFRGSAKTTLLRLFTSKRVAYGISHLILYIGANEGLAVESLSWLKRQVEHNSLWTSAFGLRMGGTWRSDEIEQRSAD